MPETGQRLEFMVKGHCRIVLRDCVPWDVVAGHLGEKMVSLD